MKRRAFFANITKFSAFAFGAHLLGWDWALADDLKLIDMTGKIRKDAVNTTAVGLAKGFGYVPDAAAAVKAKKVTLKEPGANCANCQFYGKAADPTSTCVLLAGVLVAGKGYCNMWQKKQS